MSEDTENKTVKPLQHRFEAQGDSATVTLTPVDSDAGLPTKDVEVQFGLWTSWREDDESDAKTVGRYMASWERIVDGVPELIESGAASAEKAIGAVIGKALKGKKAADFSFDLDDEYFEQKYEAPKVDKDDVWASDAFKDVRDELDALGGEAEGLFAEISEARNDAQAKQFQLFDVVGKVADLTRVGDAERINRGALHSWAVGDSTHGANRSALIKAAKSKHGLYEMAIASQMTDLMRDLAPNSMTSAKALIRHKSDGIAKLGALATAAPDDVQWPDTFVTASGVRVPDADGLLHLLRMVARDSLSLQGVAELSIGELAEAFDEAAIKFSSDHYLMHAGDVDMSDKGEAADAMLAYGLAVASSGGDGLFADALSIVETSRATAEPEKVLVKGFNSNLLVKKVVETAWAHRTTVLNERSRGQRREQYREIMDDVENDTVVSKPVAKGLAGIDATALAGHIMKIVGSHPKPAEVWQQLDTMRQIQAELDAEAVEQEKEAA